MKAETQTIRLADGRSLEVRKPSPEQDLQQLIAFFSSLPRQLRNYFRYNVTSGDICRERLKSVDEKIHWRLLAELDGSIVGSGSMDREPFGWTHHIAHVRTVVDPNLKHLGIATILLRRLVELGSASGVERFYCEVIKEHVEMIEDLEREGFVHEITRKNYARDLKGKLHDVVVLANDQSAVWRKLEEHIEELDVSFPMRHYGA